jgi:hypothetical protein
MSKKQQNKKAPSPAEIQQTLAELEALGLIRRTGEIRDGRPVFVASKFWPTNPRESN